MSLQTNGCDRVHPSIHHHRQRASERAHSAASGTSTAAEGSTHTHQKKRGRRAAGTHATASLPPCSPRIAGSYFAAKPSKPARTLQGQTAARPQPACLPVCLSASNGRPTLSPPHSPPAVQPRFCDGVAPARVLFILPPPPLLPTHTPGSAGRKKKKSDSRHGSRCSPLPILPGPLIKSHICSLGH